MNEIILTPCDVISKIKQNSSDMNEIILAPCDAGYVQSCTGLLFSIGNSLGMTWNLIWDSNLGPRFGTPIWDPDLGPRFGTPIFILHWDALGMPGTQFRPQYDPDLGP
jgi:hypothetical protein